MTHNSLVTNCQHGFIKGRSCSAILLNVLDAWTETIYKGIPIDAIYLDLTKAFDTIPHHRLLNKLNGYGIKGMVHQWIKNFLQYRRQCVNVNGVKSE